MKELHQIAERYKGLDYPWGRDETPAPTEPRQVADGVYWARFPMPMSLDHINIWASTVRKMSGRI